MTTPRSYAEVEAFCCTHAIDMCGTFVIGLDGTE
jgi:hypothetical protein